MTGDQVVSVTMPIKQDDIVVGVLLGDIQLGEIIDRVSNMRFAGGAATLTDRNAVFFASDDPNDIGKHRHRSVLISLRWNRCLPISKVDT